MSNPNESDVVWFVSGATNYRRPTHALVSPDPEQTYYRWRREYGGMKVDQARRLKRLEMENARLKRVVADQALDLSILKEVASGRLWGAAQHTC